MQFLAFLDPISQRLRSLITRYRPWITGGVVLMSLLFLLNIFLISLEKPYPGISRYAFPVSTIESGEFAMNLLWLILFLPIFARVFRISLAQALMPLRKELGILMGVMALVHSLSYLRFIPSQVFT